MIPIGDVPLQRKRTNHKSYITGNKIIHFGGAIDYENGDHYYHSISWEITPFLNGTFGNGQLVEQARGEQYSYPG